MKYRKKPVEVTAKKLKVHFVRRREGREAAKTWCGRPTTGPHPAQAVRYLYDDVTCIRCLSLIEEELRGKIRMADKFWRPRHEDVTARLSAVLDGR